MPIATIYILFIIELYSPSEICRCGRLYPGIILLRRRANSIYVIRYKENEMKRILTAPVQLWHVFLVTILVATLTSTAVVSAAPLQGFWLPGTMRMAAAFGNDSNAVHVPMGWNPVAVLQTTITIPAGKRADLAVMGEVDIESGTISGIQYCEGQIRLDNVTSGAQFRPGNYKLGGYASNPPNNFSTPINGYLGNVIAGTHTIYLVVDAGYADCLALQRSMIVLANIH